MCCNFGRAGRWRRVNHRRLESGLSKAKSDTDCPFATSPDRSQVIPQQNCTSAAAIKSSSRARNTATIYGATSGVPRIGSSFSVIPALRLFFSQGDRAAPANKVLGLLATHRIHGEDGGGNAEDKPVSMVGG